MDLEKTEKEFFWWVIKKNRAEKRIEIYKQFFIGRLKVAFEWRSKKNSWGRFGGGWNWNLGFQIGGRTIVFNLLICSLRFHLARKKDLTR